MPLPLPLPPHLRADALAADGAVSTLREAAEAVAAAQRTPNDYLNLRACGHHLRSTIGLDVASADVVRAAFDLQVDPTQGVLHRRYEAALQAQQRSVQLGVSEHSVGPSGRNDASWVPGCKTDRDHTGFKHWHTISVCCPPGACTHHAVQVQTETANRM